MLTVVRNTTKVSNKTPISCWGQLFDSFKLIIKFYTFLHNQNLVTFECQICIATWGVVKPRDKRSMTGKVKSKLMARKEMHFNTIELLGGKLRTEVRTLLALKNLLTCMCKDLSVSLWFCHSSMTHHLDFAHQRSKTVCTQWCLF